MNDKTASELITKSLSGVLSDQEHAMLDQYLEETAEAKSFAHLSSIIQKSVVEMSSVDAMAEDTSGVGLSEVSKERMRRSIREAKSSAESATYESYANVAESATAYYSGNESDPSEESRHAVSRFTLLRKIGQGGLGTVWLARDEKLRRNVAIKEMNPQAAESPKLWKRFQREAEITGHLEHPNIVPLYMSGVNPETGLPFYVMRFLGKQTLLDAIREFHARKRSGSVTPLHLHRLLNVFLDVCQAIAFAHSRGVIHRDLKPENVALDNFGQVVVLDWGLAKLETDGELATRISLSGGRDIGENSATLVGDVVGTPLYMAPEQAAGELDALDERTDVYGLGAILFSILTGVAPHQNSSRSDTGARNVKEFLTSIAKSETPLPRDFAPEVPRDLEAICLRAMAKDKFVRQSSAKELADEVEGWIAGKHEKQAKYDAMRMTGRDLKSRMCVQIRQLAVTAQFMVELPPIQGLISNFQGDSEELETWRDRLSKILLALAKTKANTSGLSFCQYTDDDRIHELVRIERSLHDVSNIRALPQSRLRRGVANTFHKMVMQQFPGECCIDFDFSTAGSIRLVAGVPVFDSENEEPFGFVVAEAEIGNLVRPEINASESAATVHLTDDNDRILFSTRRIQNKDQMIAPDLIPRWADVARVTADQGEYIETDREIYATRLPFPQGLNSLTIILQIDD